MVRIVRTSTIEGFTPEWIPEPNDGLESHASYTERRRKERARRRQRRQLAVYERPESVQATALMIGRNISTVSTISIRLPQRSA